MRDEPSPFDRRRFLQTLGLGVTSSFAMSGPVLAQAGGASRKPAKPAATRPAAPATPPASAGNGPPAPSEDARSLAEIVHRRYGEHLTPEQLEAVTRELDQRVQGGRRLRDTKFANGDEPDFTFRVEP